MHLGEQFRHQKSTVVVSQDNAAYWTQSCEDALKNASILCTRASPSPHGKGSPQSSYLLSLPTRGAESSRRALLLALAFIFLCPPPAHKESLPLQRRGPADKRPLHVSMHTLRHVGRELAL